MSESAPPRSGNSALRLILIVFVVGLPCLGLILGLMAGTLFKGGISALPLPISWADQMDSTRTQIAKANEAHGATIEDVTYKPRSEPTPEYERDLIDAFDGTPHVNTSNNTVVCFYYDRSKYYAVYNRFDKQRWIKNSGPHLIVSKPKQFIFPPAIAMKC